MSGRTRHADEREEPDEALMERYAAGDLQAFDELFQRYEPRAYVFFLRRTSSPQRSEDLYQELFLRVHRARDRFDASRRFAPWFFQIANRLLVDDNRRVYRSHEFQIGDRDYGEEQPGTDEQLAHREQIGQLLDTLSPDERYVVLAAKVQGIGYTELAEHLGKSVDAVKKMASRAMQRLRRSALADQALEASG